MVQTVAAAGTTRTVTALCTVWALSPLYMTVQAVTTLCGTARKVALCGAVRAVTTTCDTAWYRWYQPSLVRYGR